MRCRLHSLVWRTFWSDTPWVKPLYAINPPAKLLVLPALFYHFERSSRGIERFYNATRRPTIGYLSPVEFERKVGLASRRVH